MTSLNDAMVYTENSRLELDNFKPLGTIKVALFQFIFSCCLEVLVIVLFFTRENAQNSCGQIIILLFSQTALWLISFIFDDYYRSRHHFLRLGGHISYHKKLNKRSIMLIHVLSFGNVVIMCTLGILLQWRDKNLCITDDYTSPTYIILYIFTIEILLLIPNLINYMMFVTNFNNKRPLSDIEKYECWFSSDNQARSEVGYRLECEAVTEFLEKQADLIRYYKVANNDLSKRLEDVQTSIIRSNNVNGNSQVTTACEVHCRC